ncbi:calcium-activated chloride channel regulator 4A-like [Ptychodera flava]|uniref:calcium-activated chloride channel regulator 4A-like n=1 Tax=Ptychodera flava TaxID=63121 RepID=UPI00396A383A
MFGNVVIIIPMTWSDDITSERATNQTFGSSNVIIDTENPAEGDNPYTKQPSGCECKSEYIHLTPRWLTDRDYSVKYWGDSGKVLVHEWAHLQWGLFNEYPGKGEPHFYEAPGPSNHIEPIRCSKEITGRFFDDNGVVCKPDVSSDTCKFYPNDKNTASGSYMYAQHLESVISFCHSDRVDPERRSSLHNVEAPNEHNDKCHYRSAWAVMEESPDFRDGNPPLEGLSTNPSFKVVKEVEYRSVLVMDLSGSMSSKHRSDLQLQAATKYINYTLPDYSWVGIVRFDRTATILAQLTQLIDQESRQDLIDKLPNNPGGSTCIGCGLEKGMEVFENSQFATATGGIIFLTTDGEENQSPLIRDVEDELIEKGVIVDTLAFSDEADPQLESLSEKTGGKSCWYSESDESTALHDCFTASVTDRISSNPDTTIQLISYKTTILWHSTEEGAVTIDSSIGRDTHFFFFWDFNSNDKVDVTVRQPDGTTINEGDDQYYSDDALRAIVIAINGIAQEGEWHYAVANPSQHRSQVVEISIDSKSSSAHPLTLNSRTSTTSVTESPPMITIFADVSQGYSPVLQAHVIATVERPSPHESVDVQLYDTGTGADATKDDGVYAGYFIDFVEASCRQACRYGIQVTADDGDGTAVIRGVTKSSAMPRNYSVIPEPGESTSTGSFDRVASGGVIQVDDSVEYVDWSDPDNDPFPPSRISDLQVVETSFEWYTVTLQWTATGDDMDVGTASRYDLRYDTDFENILGAFENCSRLLNDNLTEGTLTDPKESGLREEVIVRLPSLDQKIIHYFSIRAVDDVNNTGQPSNIARSSIIQQPVEPAEPAEQGLQWWEILLILTVAVFGVVSLVAAAVGVYLYHKKNSKLNKVQVVHVATSYDKNDLGVVDI